MTTYPLRCGRRGRVPAWGQDSAMLSYFQSRWYLFMFPYTLSLYDFLGSILSDQSLLFQNAGLMWGRQQWLLSCVGWTELAGKPSVLNAVDHSRCLDRKPGWEKKKKNPKTLPSYKSPSSLCHCPKSPEDGSFELQVPIYSTFSQD